MAGKDRPNPSCPPAGIAASVRATASGGRPSAPAGDWGVSAVLIAPCASAASPGFDLIWFGLIMLLALEISFATPPFGLLLFVMKGMSPPGTTMRDIYMSAIPFILCALVLVALLTGFPAPASWLPSL
ncbi:TRAP transporter large permease subunit [Rhodovulum iodosum]|nr:TRAP transporter large permease subunit [Rhodovulum robiginosum]